MPFNSKGEQETFRSLPRLRGDKEIKMSGDRGQFTFFFFLFFSIRSYLRAVVSRSVEQSEVVEGTEGFWAECLPKRKACPQGAMRFFSSQSAFACRLRNVFIHGLARILCKLVIIFILFFTFTGVRYSPLNFIFLLSEDVKQTDSLWLSPLNKDRLVPLWQTARV